MALFIAYLFIQLGCALLCLGYKTHHRRLFPRRELTRGRRRSLFSAGSVALLVGLYFCTQADQLDIAITTFFGIFTLGVCLCALLLGIHRRRLNQAIHISHSQH